jgi:hypothetical protein
MCDSGCYLTFTFTRNHRLPTHPFRASEMKEIGAKLAPDRRLRKRWPRVCRGQFGPAVE